jgi:hypothetical protein
LAFGRIVGQSFLGKLVSVHGVTENHHGDTEVGEKQGWRERRQVPDGSSEGGGAPRR